MSERSEQRLALLRIHEGTLKKGQNVAWIRRDGSTKTVKITELLVTEGLERKSGESAGIGDGTAEMVAEMLRDLGYQVSAIESFRVRHLRTDYVEAGTWGHAWEITAKLSAQVAELPLQGTSVESAVTDATWSGALPALPSECVLFVDFPRADVAERAERILGDLFAAYRSDPSRLPAHVRERGAADGELRAIADYVAGMTDRFAIEEHARLAASRGPGDDRGRP